MRSETFTREPATTVRSFGAGLKRPELAILGGGPAGLAVAFYAHRADITFSLFERAASLGGLCRTYRYGAHSYDSGAHRFHDRDSEISHDLRDLMNDELIAVHAPSKIYDRGRLVDFPPSPLNIIFSGLSMREALRIGRDLIRSRWHSQRPISFADFAISQFGETLARRVLLNYSEKLWGLRADQLSPDIATRRLQGMTLRSLFVELILPWKTATHIDGSFLYPKQGYGRIVERLSDTLPRDSVRTCCEVVGLDCEAGKVSQIRFADGPPLRLTGRVVSTLPITVLVKLLGDHLPAHVHEAADKLRFRQIRLFFLRLNQPHVSSSASIYIPDPSSCISRIYEPKNRSRFMAPEHETSLVVEVPCFEDDALYSADVESLARRVISELSEIRLIDSAKVIEWRHHLLHNAYPVYSINYKDPVQTIRASMATIENLDLMGRGGFFFYSHLHDQLRFGKDYVHSITQTREVARPVCGELQILSDDHGVAQICPSVGER